MTIYRDVQLKNGTEEAGFTDIQIHKKCSSRLALRDWAKTGETRMKDEDLQFDRTCYVQSGLCRHGLLHARLVRTTTCADGCKCDYTICGDRDEYLKEHPEYVDEAGFRRNT